MTAVARVKLEYESIPILLLGASHQQSMLQLVVHKL